MKEEIKAKEAGNLKTTQEQKVIVQEKIIIIEPANPTAPLEGLIEVARLWKTQTVAAKAVRAWAQWVGAAEVASTASKYIRH